MTFARVRHTAFALAAALTTAGATAAVGAPHDREFYTGEALYQRCAAQAADPDYVVRRTACRSYVLGVSDALQAAQGVTPAGGPRPTVCLGDVAADALVERVIAWLVAHAENRRYAAPDLVGAALREAYPCP
jgi:hypothetical protein